MATLGKFAKFLFDLATDPDLQRAFHGRPDKIMEERGLNTYQIAAIKSRDRGKITSEFLAENPLDRDTPVTIAVWNSLAIATWYANSGDDRPEVSTPPEPSAAKAKKLPKAPNVKTSPKKPKA